MMSNSMFRWLFLTFAMLCAGALCQAETPQTPPTRAVQIGEIVNRISDAQAHGNELSALNLVGEMKSNSNDDSRRLISELAAPLDSVVGNYREALRDFDDAHGSHRPPLSSAKEYPLRDLRKVDALSQIVSMAADVQIVMINEAHHVPQHRAFSIELLKRLRRKGFSYFAAETLDEKDTQLEQRGYPVKASGYYTAEPVYGELIRTALRLGYHVVAYDLGSPKNAEDREQSQAQNLMYRIFQSDPHAKVLIHAGYEHINEAGLLVGVPTLAQRLAKMTGQDPLTIDQTRMCERSTEDGEHPIYQFLMAHSPISEPTVFVDGRGQPWTLEPGVRDITLFHPRSRYVDGRPTWLALSGTRRPYKLPHGICGSSERCLVKARNAHESADAIPIDELEVIGAQRPAMLMLPRGEFTLDVQDAAGITLNTLRVKRR